MAAASVFVLSSRQEGMPNALIQAVSLGVPCVAADAPGGIAEVLQGGQVGWLAPAENPAELAKVIGSALDGGGSRQPTQAWYSLFGSELSLDRYEELLFDE
jgi:glycosyltransferase involved in cell wall biosynthesis